MIDMNRQWSMEKDAKIERLEAEVNRLREALAITTEVAAEHQRREWEGKAKIAAAREIIERVADAGITSDTDEEMYDGLLVIAYPHETVEAARKLIRKDGNT